MAGRVQVERWDAEREGPVTEDSLRRKLEAQGYQCTSYTFPPGTHFPDHTHSVTKKDAIVSGRFQFGMFGQSVELGAGDMVEVPKNTVHNARVIGNQAVVFLDSTK